MKVVLSGGGTLGSVSPLLAVVEELRKMDSEIEFLWIGTRAGPEKKLVEENQIPFKSIIVGKWRRYFDLRNFFDLFKVGIGFWQSIFILRKFKYLCHSEGAKRPKNLVGGVEQRPTTVAGRPAGSREILHSARNDGGGIVFVSAGGFVSLPAAFAAFILRIPVLVHQQDVVPGLANKLMSVVAKKITVSLNVSLQDFPKQKTELIGNPVRSFVFSGNREKVLQKFNLKRDLPIVLVMGGGTGAKAINELIISVLPELVKYCQIIHLTGKGKLELSDSSVLLDLSNYYPLEFATAEIPDFYAAADLVISRAGMSSLSEICALGKPAIIVPIPKSHQEKNAEYFASRGAIKVFKQPFPVIPSASFCHSDSVLFTKSAGEESCGSEAIRASFINLVKELLFNQFEREKLSENAKKIMPSDAGQRLAKIIQDVAK